MPPPPPLSAHTKPKPQWPLPLSTAPQFISAPYYFSIKSKSFWRHSITYTPTVAIHCQSAPAHYCSGTQPPSISPSFYFWARVALCVLRPPSNLFIPPFHSSDSRFYCRTHNWSPGSIWEQWNGRGYYCLGLRPWKPRFQNELWIWWRIDFLRFWLSLSYSCLLLLVSGEKDRNHFLLFVNLNFYSHHQVFNFLLMNLRNSRIVQSSGCRSFEVLAPLEFRPFSDKTIY